MRVFVSCSGGSSKRKQARKCWIQWPCFFCFFDHHRAPTWLTIDMATIGGLMAAAPDRVLVHADAIERFFFLLEAMMESSPTLPRPTP